MVHKQKKHVPCEHLYAELSGARDANAVIGSGSISSLHAPSGPGGLLHMYPWALTVEVFGYVVIHLEVHNEELAEGADHADALHYSRLANESM